MKILPLFLVVLAGIIFQETLAKTGLAASVPGQNAMVNGTFDEGQKEESNQPKDWRTEGIVKRVKERKGDWKLKLTGKTSSPNARAIQTVSIPEGSAFVTVSTLVKAVDIQSPNDDLEGTAILTVQFLNKDGQPVGKSLKSKEWDGSFSWRPWSGHARVPAEAVKLEVWLELRGAVGRVLFDDVELSWGLPEDFDRSNFVVDGGFEYFNPLSAWSAGEGHRIIYPGFKGEAALSMGPSPSGKSSTLQELVIENASAIRKASLELNARFDGVKSSGKDGGAKAEIEFRDEEERLIDTAVIGPWTGTKDWTRLTARVAIPPKTRHAELRLVMDHAGGAAQFDEVRLELQDKDGMLERPLESRTKTDAWKTFHAVPGPVQDPLDMSHFLDAPAGKHGFLQARQDGHFYFEDGTRARFFGINLQPPQALPTHAEAELFAARLAQLGFNLVRLHHLDGMGEQANLFDPNFDDTQHFSKESLDRLDYFMAQLKSHGIYIYLDLLVSRKFKSGDGVRQYLKLSRMTKGVAQFDRRLIELQKKFAYGLLTHVNPYTQKKLSEEPAIVLMEIANENSLCRFNRKFPEWPQVYADEMRRLWVKRLASRGVSNPETQADRFRELKNPEVQAFYADLQRSYFREMSAYLREVGLKIPLAGSNFAYDGNDLATNAELDFIDRHAYWDPPQGGYGDFVRFHNRLIAEEIEPKIFSSDSRRLNPIVSLARLKVSGKPFVVGEWNIDWPNEYRAAGPLLMTAYAVFQDWDAIIQFNFEGNLEPDFIKGNFDVSTKPEIFLQYAAAARLFHGRYMMPARERVNFPILEESEMPAFLGLLHGIGRTLEHKPIPDFPGRSHPVASDTNELRWDDQKGIILIEAPKIVAAIGKMDGNPVRFKAAEFNLPAPFASVSLVSLDGLTLTESKRLLLTAVARAENTGTLYNATRTFLRSSGTPPILWEPVTGFVAIPLKGRILPKVFVLDAGGKRLNEIPVRAKDQSFEIPLGEAQLYEISFGETQ